jgi:predicted PurR-regulated permease PerM
MYFIVVMVLLVLAAIGRILEPFWGAIVVAFVIALLCWPLYAWLERKLPRASPSFRALIADIVVLLFLLGPIVALAVYAMEDIRHLGPVVLEWGRAFDDLQEGRMTSRVGWLRPVHSTVARITGVSGAQVQAWITQSLKPIADELAARGAEALSGIFGLLAGLLLVLFTLFFLFRDGPAYYRRLRALFPLEPDYQDRLFGRVESAIHEIFRGWFLTALVQGVAATTGFLIASVPSAVLLGMLACPASVIPTIGTGLVWGPVGVILLMNGEVGRGLFVLGWGLAMVGTIDNILAPFLIGRRVRLPLLFLLLSILGSIPLFGIKGLILGPLIFSVAPTVLEIYREKFLARTPPH